jgi:hypothetical protein
MIAEQTLRGGAWEGKGKQRNNKRKGNLDKENSLNKQYVPNIPLVNTRTMSTGVPCCLISIPATS